MRWQWALVSLSTSIRWAGLEEDGVEGSGSRAEEGGSRLASVEV
jgi:hypothetical protein